MITVYTKPDHCKQCDMTKDVLRKEGIEFQELNIYDHMDLVRELKYASAPVVVVTSELHWSGFRPDLIKALKEGIKL